VIFNQSLLDWISVIIAGMPLIWRSNMKNESGFAYN